MKIKSLVLVVALVAVFSGCGGGGGSSGDDTTRTLGGTFSGGANASVAQAKSGAMPVAKVLSSDSCVVSGLEICRVIATATDATTVSDTMLSDCRFSLPLLIGKRYVISFVGANDAGTACDEFIATMIASSGPMFNISAGDAIDFGDVFMNSDGTATFSGSEDAMSGIIESCAEAGYDDTDEDGVCDWSDGGLPTEPGDASTACADDSECGSGEYCSTYGYCALDDYRVCEADSDCGAGYACSNYYVCVPGTSSGIALTEFDGLYYKDAASDCTDTTAVLDHSQYFDVTTAGSIMIVDMQSVTGCTTGFSPDLTPTVVGDTFELDGVVFTDEVCPNSADAGTTNKLIFSMNASSKMQVVRQITNSAASTLFAPVGCSVTYVKTSGGTIWLQAK